MLSECQEVALLGKMRSDMLHAAGRRVLVVWECATRGKAAEGLTLRLSE